MDKFTIEEFFANGHKNVGGIFILLSNAKDPEVQKVLSNIKRDENLRKQFDEIMQNASTLEMVSVENMLVDLTSTAVFHILKQYYLVSLINNNKEIHWVSNDEFSRYYSNLQILKNAINDFRKFLVSIQDISKEINLKNFLAVSGELPKRYDMFEDFMKELGKFYLIADRCKKLCFNKCSNFADFSGLIIPLNKKLIGHLKTSAIKLSKIKDFGFGHTDKSVETINEFVREWEIFSEHMIRVAKTDKQNKHETQAELEKSRLIKARIAPIVSPAEQSRRDMVKRANDLYRELCQDYIRDLENQYAHSTKDMYDYFMAKYNKFLEKFEMPLVDSTTIGVATDACAQIRGLMNYVSKISENSYTTSVYSVDKK